MCARLLFWTLNCWDQNELYITSDEIPCYSFFPRPFPPPLLDRLQHANTEGKAWEIWQRAVMLGRHWVDTLGAMPNRDLLYNVCLRAGSQSVHKAATTLFAIYDAKDSRSEMWIITVGYYRNVSTISLQVIIYPCPSPLCICILKFKIYFKFWHMHTVHLRCVHGIFVLPVTRTQRLEQTHSICNSHRIQL